MRSRACFILLLMPGLMISAGGTAGASELRVSARLTATDTVDNLLLGRRLAFNGAIIAVGSAGSRASGARRPATYIFFRRPDGEWVQKQEIAAGGALSVLGGRLLVGDAVYRLNSAHVFIRRARLAPRQPQPDSGFGEAVALFSGGKRAAVAAPFASVDGVSSAGAVYIFQYTRDSGWTRVARLTAPAPRQGRDFGLALAADGPDSVLVGAPIATGTGKAGAYLFRRDADGWHLHASFTGANGTGAAVALNDDTALVGTDGGPVRVYTRKAQGRWTRRATLKRPRGQTGAFGFDVALGGHHALIGFPPAQLETNGGDVALEAGRALVYVRQPSGNWEESAEVGPYDDSRNLGYAVALDQGAYLVADPEADTLGHERAGVAYVLTARVHEDARDASTDGGGGAVGVPGLLCLLALAGLASVRRVRYGFRR